MLDGVSKSAFSNRPTGSASNICDADDNLRRLAALRVRRQYDRRNDVTLYRGKCQSLLRRLGPQSVDLVLTSPPYNLGKSYETRRSLEEYLKEMREILDLLAVVVKDRGTLCWQVGSVLVGPSRRPIPLDLLMYNDFVSRNFFVQNRIVWHFEHGKNRTSRLSGRHETLLWLTRDESSFTFNMNAIRAPQKYPAKKAYKGPRKGQYLSNPLGKNPGDVWIFPNVKQNHPEKTDHPCQFPFELAERAIRAFSNKGDLVVDPFMGVGTTALAAAYFGRRFAGAELVRAFVDVAEDRLEQLATGTLRLRRMNTPVHTPRGKLTIPPWSVET
ncbi:MAG TPA: site-specific DNA-methyltransferase [Candidatus Elarobacter sp.]